MNTPTKRIFYLFGPKFAKNEPQTKVWGSLTCKPQFSQPVARAFALVARVRAVRAGRSRLRACSRWSQPVARAFAEAGCAPAAALRPVRRAGGLIDAGLLLGALDSSHLLLGKPNGTVIFSVVRSGAAVVAQVGASCFQRRHVVRRA